MTRELEPRRLREGQGRAADVVKEANAAYCGDARGAAEEEAWQKLARRLEGEERVPRRTLWIALPTLAAAALVLFWVGHRPAPELVTGVEREPVPVVSDAKSPPATAEAPRPAPSAAHRGREPLGPAPRPPVDCAAPTSAQERASCLELAAATPGLNGERALVELATLRRDALADPGGAVAALRQYRSRYPEGVLRGEVDFALVDTLPEVGLIDEALAESAALLEKPWGRTRESELRLARGRLYQDHQGNCTAALQELGAIRSEFGPVGDEAEFRFAQCQEQNGDRAGARATYDHYLTRPAPRRAEAAAKRRAELTSALR